MTVTLWVLVGIAAWIVGYVAAAWAFEYGEGLVSGNWGAWGYMDPGARGFFFVLWPITIVLYLPALVWWCFSTLTRKITP